MALLQRVFASVLVLGTLSAPPSAFAEETKAPWSQAEPYYDRDAFARSRDALIEEHGGRPGSHLIAERLEYQSSEGSPLLVFEGQGWWGGDKNKLWLKSEIEYDFTADEFGEVEAQALWSRSISRYFDIQAGLRHDFEPDSRTFAVVGVQGLVPYWFEIDAALFVSSKGDVSARLETEYDLLLTQRLVLQPRGELNLAVQEVADAGLGRGLSTAELGVRLRYEFTSQFAPYVGVNWERAVGDTADFARIDGEEPGAVSFVAGLRFWF